MRRNILLVFCGAVLLAACQGRQDVAVVGTVYNSDVANALQQYQGNATKKRAELVFDSDATAQSCDEYLRLIATSPLKEDVNNQLAKGEYLLCEVPAIIGNKQLSAGRQDVSL